MMAAVRAAALGVSSNFDGPALLGDTGWRGRRATHTSASGTWPGAGAAPGADLIRRSLRHQPAPALVCGAGFEGRGGAASTARMWARPGERGAAGRGR